jgi:hypothetical protein
VPEDVTDLAVVVRGIRSRARFSRMSALVIVCTLTMIGVGTAYLFLSASSIGNTVVVTAQAGATASYTASSFEWLGEITRSFIRIASVIMAVFIINILVSFARYNLRVSNYLDARADCLVITAGDSDKFAALLPSLSVDPLDFMKTPLSPYDTYLATLRGFMPSRSQLAGKEGAGHDNTGGDTHVRQQRPDVQNP